MNTPELAGYIRKYEFLLIAELGDWLPSNKALPQGGKELSGGL